MMPPAGPLSDIESLLHGGQTRPRVGSFWFVVGLFLLMVMFGSYVSNQYPDARPAMHVVSGLVMIGLFIGMSLLTGNAVRRQRQEQQQLESIEELMQLRRWDEAARLVEDFLSRPLRIPAARVQGLIYLTSILARFNRFEDAIAVHNFVLENVQLDPGTQQALRIGRAMAMLREDHLFDADRAIAELRRGGGDDSAGLALVELYRDVKTGHPTEAIELFHQRRESMRNQLGHRFADAYVLVARAYDLLGRESEARNAYHNATVLAPATELSRRYPETAGLLEKYGATPAPPEAA